MTVSIIQSSPKKGRKPQKRTLAIQDAIVSIAAEYERMTIRQLYYQLVTRQHIEKTEAAYAQVVYHSGQLRISGALPYSKIADGNRTRRTPNTFDGLGDVLEATQRSYRRDYWIGQRSVVEIWCEKDALSGVIQPICDKYGVTFVATRGFPSHTLIYESAMSMIESRKHTNLYYFGDHDPSGRVISDNLFASLQQHNASVSVYRMALQPSQIAEYELPTRPTKKKDSRNEKFTQEYGDQCVELDALPPNILVAMVEDCIVCNINQKGWERMRRIEAEEQATLIHMLASFKG